MSQVNHEKFKLMVVDDEPENVELLQRTFRREFRVFTAESALQALEILETEGEMAIIISDQRMPVMNGTEFLGKTVERFPDTIRILLTGYTDVEDLVEAINSGKVYKYITKPWNPEKLKTAVEEAKETYRFLKRRTDELCRALRREELFNVIISAIRESLDYQSMLQTIVQTISENFGVQEGILKPVLGQQLQSKSFCYQAPKWEKTQQSSADFQSLLEKALSSGQTQKIELQDIEANYYSQIALPLVFGQELLAVLYLYHYGYQPWAKSDLELLEAVASQAALAISQAKLYQRTQQQAQKMRDELEVARQIQNNLLRQSLPKVEGLNVQAVCYPAREVGGDFFEVYFHPQGDLWLAVGDVSGKGVPAALFMASAISLLRRELAQENPPEPDVVMANLNQAMSENLISANCFITMVIARYRITTRQLVYASAGHIYPMVWSHHQLRDVANTPDQLEHLEPNYLKARSIPIGILPVWKAKAGSLILNQGDILLLISDGITEATVTKKVRLGSHEYNNLKLKVGSMLNQEGLWQLISQVSHPFDLHNLLGLFSEHTNEVQEDDQTILSLEIL